MSKVRVALDWTPNTIHLPLIIARDRGFYKEVGLDVELTDPSQDNYSKTPARKLVEGSVDLAVCPSESVIAFTSSHKKIQAVATLLAKDASVIASLPSYKRPRDLSGRRYASYGARYEDAIINHVIHRDGGSSPATVVQPPKLEIWKALQAEEVDFTWIFLPWEGVQARRANVQLSTFHLKDYDVPYGYSPVLARDPAGALSDDVLTKFMIATRRGFQLLRDSREEAVDIMCHHCSEDREMIRESLSCIEEYCVEEDGSYGTMKEEKWRDFIDFLKGRRLVEELTVEELFTNRFVQ
ncbi:NMT1/THI5 like domain-containing protein [Planoprotostelium fungivorum]|uniref:Thiamine pyrimidine synthase n=1 Tax=Planoprotostelium fungivorum TaxID=1890364 RepID=A0A2P6MV34_9EUKA|nr:NMT1/THI5 like domain-containing protein [Planoprotostelium fungivorum]